MAALTPSQLENKWTQQEFTAANYDKIDDSYLRRFTTDLVATFGPGAAPVTAQLLGLDPATGELLILLSPGAPTSLASYVLADYSAGTTPPAPSGGFPYAFPASIP